LNQTKLKGHSKPGSLAGYPGLLLKLVADETGVGKTFTSVATVLLCKVVTENVVMGLPLSIL
jgi:hypothetical protein